MVSIGAVEGEVTIPPGALVYEGRAHDSTRVIVTIPAENWRESAEVRIRTRDNDLWGPPGELRLEPEMGRIRYAIEPVDYEHFQLGVPLTKVRVEYDMTGVPAGDPEFDWLGPVTLWVEAADVDRRALQLAPGQTLVWFDDGQTRAFDSDVFRDTFRIG